MTSTTAERDLAREWPTLDRRAAGAIGRARRVFEEAVASGGDVVAAWVSFRALCLARVELGTLARTAAGEDGRLAARIVTGNYGPTDFAAAVASATEKAATQRAEGELAALLGE